MKVESASFDHPNATYWISLRGPETALLEFVIVSTRRSGLLQ
ncbi:MAG: hypothetical protein UIM53_03165 [Acutalibacteraceae bacterium]|nr:hypothetical protein [Acutalibacteraceae bacterium]